MEVLDDNINKALIIASYSKILEFNLLVSKKTSEKAAFFLSPSLRGICEDFIVLKFLKKHKIIDANILLRAYFQKDLAESVEKQKVFFRKMHPQQVVLDLKNSKALREKSLGVIKDELQKIGLRSEREAPSVNMMAVDAGLTKLYDYFYAAASQMVHFSPHNLNRLGWSTADNPGQAYFSTINFYKYYNLFNRFYGSYLFVLFSKTFRKDIGIPANAWKLILKIEEQLSLESRWPEIVTFEEMNVENAEDLRLQNAVEKLSIIGKKHGLSDDEIRGEIFKFLVKVEETKAQKKAK